MAVIVDERRGEHDANTVNPMIDPYKGSRHFHTTFTFFFIIILYFIDKDSLSLIDFPEIPFNLDHHLQDQLIAAIQDDSFFGSLENDLYESFPDEDEILGGILLEDDVRDRKSVV